MRRKNEKINNCIHICIRDTIKMFFLSLIFGLVICILLFLFGFFLKGDYQNGLEVSKNGLFFFSSILLFILAGLLIIKGKKQEQAFDHPEWKKHFQIIGLKTVILLLCLSFIMLASVLDYCILKAN